MRSILKLVLPLMTVALLLTACGKKDAGYIINQSNTDTPATEITAFYEGNPSTLAAIAKELTEGGAYACYNYSARMTDYESGTMEFFVQKQVKTATGSLWQDCDDEPMSRLTAVKFVGTVTYDPAVHGGVVLFTPRLNTTDRTLALAYCPDADGKTALEDGRFHADSAVTVTEVAAGWYCVEAIPTAEAD